MATRKQSNPKAALGDLFAGPNDRQPAPLPKLGEVPGTPGFWGRDDRQAYVDSRPGSTMYEQNGSHLVGLMKRELARIDAEAAQRREAADRYNSQKRF